jgi:aspartate aminotransferase-like enzyme
MDFPTIDHRGTEFTKLNKQCLEGMKAIFKMTKGLVFIYPASGTGAWEAAIVNTLSPGDRVLMFETGHFPTLWRKMATAFGLVVDFVPGDWRHGVEKALAASRNARLPKTFWSWEDNFNLSLGAGLAKLTGKVFRIGQLGDLNDLMLCGTLCGVEMGLELFGVPFQKGGVATAMDFWQEEMPARPQAMRSEWRLRLG